MGSDMTNLKNSNLKVPPLKIVLSSATSGGSDRSTSTSPSSESESLDSNLTIISENQQERSGRGSDNKDDAIQDKYDKVSRNTAKGNGSGASGASVGGGCSGPEQKLGNATTNVTSVSNNNKRPHLDHNNEINYESTATAKETTLSSNQRITRSSQRAAQQNKSENSNETNGDDTNLADSQDKSSSELGQRKVKRRKGEQAEVPEDSNQQVQQPPVVMANICPANYQLPSQNSFELYRDIRNRPHMKMMKLNLVPPKVPHGFRDYIIYGGPYLLDGNKVGLGLSGGKIDSPGKPSRTIRGPSHNHRGGMKPASNLRQVSTNQMSFNQRHSSYIIPKSLDAPMSLRMGSPLFILFQDQEAVRQKMRMQHLKERERSVLASEQEILRAYNQVTIADNQQTLHLSACTYFFYQERYHYVDEKSNYLDSINQKDSSQSRENSDSCNAESSATSGSNKHEELPDGPTANSSEVSDKAVRSSNEVKEDKSISSSNSDTINGGSDAKPPPKKRVSEQDVGDRKDGPGETKSVCDTDSSKSSKNSEESVAKQDSKRDRAIDNNNSSSNNYNGSGGDSASVKNELKRNVDKATNGDDLCNNGSQTSVIASDSDASADTNRAAFVNNLQEIDNKWAKIKDEMFVRHKNESDSLYAVQCLEWEWKAKETGVCDVRLSLRVDPMFVPRVSVSALDY